MLFFTVCLDTTKHLLAGIYTFRKVNVTQNEGFSDEQSCSLDVYAFYLVFVLDEYKCGLGLGHLRTYTRV